MKILETINTNNLINSGDIIGVACSGGSDSMALLHFLTNNKKELGIEVVAININHKIRENSKSDSNFVLSYCKKNNIKCYQFNIDAIKIMQQDNLTLEEAARKVRYSVFNSLLERNVINKIALGHHVSDQVETVLLNIFRGTGLNGASGMEYKRGSYIRPLLDTTKKEILDYIKQNNIDFVTDETNFQNDANRNYIRNDIIPLIKQRWKNVENNILTFSKICKEDDEYIKKQVYLDGVIKDNNLVKIPLSYFNYDNSVVIRLIQDCFAYLNVQKDMERKHILSIINLAKTAKNGSRITLPNKLSVHKEYDFITLNIKPIIATVDKWIFKCGKTKIEGVGEIIVKKQNDATKQNNNLIIDADKLPKNIVWRFRNDGDIIEKFGGGTKKLKSYLIDKKIPLRERNILPVLACENEIFVIAGVEISNKLKIDSNSKKLYSINFIRKN